PDCRFIPAYAGNTCPPQSLALRQPVHPRVRGEHFLRAGDFFAAAGSSPRTRGTPYAGGGRAHVQRFIPAYAGNTNSRGSSTMRQSVHPRVRGEHEPGDGEACVGGGSSPRTRGTRRANGVTGL